jgi:hypothetical protein
LQAQALATSLSLMPPPQHDPSIHKHLHCNLVLGCAKEYSKATHALAPFSLASTSSNITLVLTTLHFKSDGYFSFFLKDYERDQYFKFSSKFFKLAFQRMPHLLANGLFGMVFEHLQNYFHLKNLVSGFL